MNVPAKLQEQIRADRRVAATYALTMTGHTLASAAKIPQACLEVVPAGHDPGLYNPASSTTPIRGLLTDRLT